MEHRVARPPACEASRSPGSTFRTKPNNEERWWKAAMDLSAAHASARRLWQWKRRAPATDSGPGMTEASYDGPTRG